MTLAVPGVAEDKPNKRENESRWPAWRGPDDNGSGAPGSYPVELGDDRIVWKAALPGKGCSTPVVWDDHLIVTSPVGTKDAVLAFNWSGEKRWQTIVGPGTKGKASNGSGANPSVATDGEGIYAYFKSGNLACLDFAGKILWQTNLVERFGRFVVYWDQGTSPVLTDGDVVVAVMHEGDSFIAAFDKKTGEMRWKTAREYKTPVEGDHSYTTPHVVDSGGKQTIVTWGAEHLTAHDAADGRLLWSCGGFNPDEKRNWVAVASSVIAGNLAVVPYGRGSWLAGIRLGGTGDVTGTNRLWTRKGIGSFVPTPAVEGSRVYVLGDKGEVVCIDVKSGKTLWEGKLPRAADKYYASPAVASGKLYAAREDGIVFVADVTGELKVLSENDLGERIIASPVPVNDRLLLRGEKHLFCFSAR